MIRITGASAAEPPRYSLLDSLLNAKQSIFSTRAFLGKDGIALVRLGEYTQNAGPGRYKYACDSLAWVIAGSGTFPRSLEFERVIGCLPDLGTGDTLIVPVEANEVASDLSFSQCPRGWRVKDAYVVGFGVHLDYLNYAIDQQAGGLVPRTFLESE